MKSKIVVVGTGYVGLPAALMLAKAGCEVVGVDINENVVRAINERTMLINEEKLQALMADPDVQKNLVAMNHPEKADVFIIAVPTPVDHARKVADLRAVREAIRSICPHLQKGNLVILESTVPPTTCRNIIKPIIEENTDLKVPEDVMLAHCPERILPGDIWNEIINNDRLIGGMDEASTKAATTVYAEFVRGQLIATDDVTAELSKLMENTYRDVNIALANELSVICEQVDVDPREAIRLANRHPRVNILNPGIGVGGHCIPVDPWFLKEIAPTESVLISAARFVNDGMPMRIAAKIRKAVRHIDNPKIVALGASYKKNCEDTRESPANEIVRLLSEDGYEIRHFDPLVPRMACSSVLDVSAGADVLVVLVGHDCIIKEISAKRAKIVEKMRTPNIIIFDIEA
jgi:UDP-N-acetyl-D-mannosaminuronic acid dehydrogenase